VDQRAEYRKKSKRVRVSYGAGWRKGRKSGSGQRGKKSRCRETVREAEKASKQSGAKKVRLLQGKDTRERRRPRPRDWRCRVQKDKEG